MSTSPGVPARARSLLRPFLAGFAVGFLVTVPSAVLALLVPALEQAARLLRPGVVLLRPLEESLAAWPAAVNLLLGSLANGLVVGAAVVAVAVLRRAWRAR